MSRPRPVYSRSLVADLAGVIQSVRYATPLDHHRTLDRLVDEIVELVHEHDPTFDIETFRTRCHYRR